MKPGDKVRMLRGKEEGFVTKIINDKLVEIEIEDGFRIPAMRSELVVVASEEGNYFTRTEEATPALVQTRRSKPADEGFFLAFHALNDKDLSVFLLNNTSDVIPFTVYYQTKSGIQGKNAGHLNAHSFLKLDEFQRRTFDEWPEFIIQFLTFAKDKLPAPAEKRIKFKAKTLFKEEKQAPLIDKKAFMFDLMGTSQEFDMEKLQKKFTEGDSGSSTVADLKAFYERPADTVDLHIEKLREDHSTIPANQILNIQLQAFEKGLDSAIAGGLKEVTFIHGVGNGVLRNAIHKQLSKHPEIAFYKDAMKEKFGYGATLVQFV